MKRGMPLQERLNIPSEQNQEWDLGFSMVGGSWIINGGRYEGEMLLEKEFLVFIFFILLLY